VRETGAFPWLRSVRSLAWYRLRWRHFPETPSLFICDNRYSYAQRISADQGDFPQSLFRTR
jgi:hypothetical protein